jgi:hypothetical protein
MANAVANISGAMPQAADCNAHPNATGVPHGPGYCLDAPLTAAVVSPPAPPSKEELEPLCNNFCLRSPIGMAKPGIPPGGYPVCSSICMMQNGASLQDVEKWGYPDPTTFLGW